LYVMLSIEDMDLFDFSWLGLIPSEDMGMSSAGSFVGSGAYVSGGKTNHTFGNEFEPDEFGIGGRGARDDLISHGGGALELLGGDFQLNGDVRAIGGAATADTAGGSGGSISMMADSLPGLGTISADGSYGALTGINGGGGRISLTYREIGSFNPGEQLSAAGGESIANGSGSIYVHQSYDSTRVRKIHLRPITADASGRIMVEFSEELNRETFTTDDILLTNGSGAEEPVFEVGKVDEHLYWIQSHEALPNDHYQIRIGPNISSTSGIEMDQDRDGIAGESEGDVFVYDFEIFAADQVVTE